MVLPRNRTARMTKKTSMAVTAAKRTVPIRVFRKPGNILARIFVRNMIARISSPSMLVSENPSLFIRQILLKNRERIVKMALNRRKMTNMLRKK